MGHVRTEITREIYEARLEKVGGKIYILFISYYLRDIEHTNTNICTYFMLQFSYTKFVFFPLYFNL